MSLDAFAGAFAGFACLALATRRAQQQRILPAIADAGRLRLLGALLLALSLGAAVARLGGPIGVVAWIGTLCLAGGAVVLLLSRSARSLVPAAAGVAAVWLVQLAFYPAL